VDDFSNALEEAYGQPSANWDIFDSTTMTEPSIIRARSIRRSDKNASWADFRALPGEDKSFDTVFAMFVLHEIRDNGDRAKCLREVARCLSDDGRLVIVEHLRDLANSVAFGPGFLHFLPRSTWLEACASAGFTVEREASLTPFVRVFVTAKQL
jgi:ubiquinone/menaquinone biosynthesis C-methylase UbiE